MSQGTPGEPLETIYFRTSNGKSEDISEREWEESQNEDLCEEEED